MQFSDLILRLTKTLFPLSYSEFLSLHFLKVSMMKKLKTLSLSRRVAIPDRHIFSQVPRHRSLTQTSQTVNFNSVFSKSFYMDFTFHLDEIIWDFHVNFVCVSFRAFVFGRFSLLWIFSLLTFLKL